MEEEILKHSAPACFLGHPVYESTCATFFLFKNSHA